MHDAARGPEMPPPSRVSRRQALCRIGLAGLSASLGVGRSPVATAQDDQRASGDLLVGAALPPDVGQADLQVYVEATGHRLRGLFLDYWRANGAASVYGFPISSPFVAGDGSYSQAFERGIFQYRPEFLHTTAPIVRLMPLGRIALQEWPRSPGAVDWHSRSVDGDDDVRWERLLPAPSATARDAGAGDPENHDRAIAAGIRSWYTFNEGSLYLGQALSRPIVVNGTTAQWFEAGPVLATDGEIRLAPLASALAPHLGIDTSPTPRDDLPLFDELLFWSSDNPNPRGDPYAPGAKWIEVSLGEQRLWAYHGDTLISTTLVSTGRDPNPTERGMFRVRLKYPAQDMQGFTSATGEVTSVGDAAPDPGAIPYAVAAVPDVLYFNLDAEALHGTHWHSNFGTPVSHGCVNLPLDFAAWLYGWAPLGTGVWVHD
jgi:hypothetical protein